jgi:DnaK suppressor protein
MEKRMDKDKLNNYREQLLAMKAEAEEQIKGNDSYDSAKEFPNDSIGEMSTVVNHPGDLGTELHDRETAQTLKESARERLRDIEDALDRIEEGTYGLSEKSGKQIPEERLQAEPTARLLVEEQAEEEEARRI